MYWQTRHALAIPGTTPPTPFQREKKVAWKAIDENCAWKKKKIKENGLKQILKTQPLHLRAETWKCQSHVADRSERNEDNYVLDSKGILQSRALPPF